MAERDTVLQVVEMLFSTPLANKPKPLTDSDDVIQQTTKIYWLTLRDVDDELLRAATVNHIASSKWFPSPADLRQSASLIIQRADDIPDSYVAWQQVKSGRDMHPLACQAFELLGGWKSFGQSKIVDEPSWRARFIAAYDQLKQRQIDDATMLPSVAGYIEKRKELMGQSVQELIAGAADKMKAPGL